ncbi:uncharacterized protein VTP21DRAFT_5580 [Calcarisporiella thermophila]|uniref:uncharacterized protein n=1 Tax=Calcarisporiella thermophila TaxID=911321 RepID=UPI0037423231
MADKMQVENVAGDNSLTDSNVVTKYRMAGDIVHEALQQVANAVKPDVSVLELCKFGDELILSMTSKLFTKKKQIKKGIAFPTSVCVNNTVQNFSPGSEQDSAIIRAGDVVKIELGAQVDGYVATAAHTVVANPTADAATGRVADVICAAHFAMESAVRVLKAGAKSTDVTKAIADAAAAFNCRPVVNAFSHPIKRFEPTSSTRVIPCGEDREQPAEEFTIEAGEVYSLNVVVSTGEGKAKETGDKPTILQRNASKTYSLKLKTARAVFTDINERFGVFPFPIRALDTRSRMGLTECFTHELIVPHMTRVERAGEFVAQLKTTILLVPTGGSRIVAPLALPNVHSEYQVPEAITALLRTSGAKTVKHAKVAGATVSMGEKKDGDAMDLS